MTIPITDLAIRNYIYTYEDETDTYYHGQLRYPFLCSKTVAHYVRELCRRASCLKKYSLLQIRKEENGTGILVCQTSLAGDLASEGFMKKKKLLAGAREVSFSERLMWLGQPRWVRPAGPYPMLGSSMTLPQIESAYVCLESQARQLFDKYLRLALQGRMSPLDWQ
jgi:hypothetical protein